MPRHGKTDVTKAATRQSADSEIAPVKAPESSREKTLDFTVIGAQRAGTTSLWMYMRTHPELYLPSDKEVSFFTRERRYANGLDWYLSEHFSLARPGAMLGTVTPHYMAGTEEVSLETAVERMHSTVPDIKLIALLRDPIERAFSEYRLTVHRGLESRRFGKAIRRQLDSNALDEARVAPTKGATYVVQGEYGRILDLYLQRFSRDQLLVVATDDLSARPKRTMSRIFKFLGVDPEYVPENLGHVYFRGGTSRRVSARAADELRKYLAERVWPRIPDRLAARDAEAEFAFWFQQWNVVPNAKGNPDLQPSMRRALEQHFRADAELLSRVAGFDAPWVEQWGQTRRGVAGSSAPRRGNSKRTVGHSRKRTAKARPRDS